VLYLSGVNTYTGPTIVNNGVIALTGSGSINNSVSIEVTAPDVFDVNAVTGGYVLGAAQTLRGIGTVSGAVTANGRVAPGNVPGIGTLTFDNNLTLNASAKLEMDINRTNSPNHDTLVVSGAFAPGGTLLVTNIGPALAKNDTFDLFSQPVVGSFSLIQLPTLAPGLSWTNKLALDGSIAVVGPPTPTNITVSVSGGNLTLNWPAGEGWNLQARTNSLTVGPWYPVPGAVPPLVIPIDPANAEVYYRLVYP